MEPQLRGTAGGQTVAIANGVVAEMLQKMMANPETAALLTGVGEVD